MCKHSDKNQWLTSFNMHIFKKLQTRNSLRGFVPPSVCWSICQHELGWIPMPTRPQQYLWPRITCWSSFRSVAQFEKKTIQFSTSFFITLVVIKFWWLIVLKVQHDASEQPHKQMQNKNHWKKPKNGGGKGKSLKIGGDWKPESLSTLVERGHSTLGSLFCFSLIYSLLTSIFDSLFIWLIHSSIISSSSIDL